MSNLYIYNHYTNKANSYTNQWVWKHCSRFRRKPTKRV